jgi:hypothetical protein
MEETPDNVVKFPMTNAMRVRRKVNSTKDALLGKEQVRYSKAWSEPTAPVEGALDNHIENAIANSGMNFGRNNADFESGQHEAKILSIGAHKLKKNMSAGDASVDRMINMEDPTKD